MNETQHLTLAKKERFLLQIVRKKCMNAMTSNLKSDKSRNAIRLILLQISWHFDVFYYIDTQQNWSFENNHFILQEYGTFVHSYVGL